MKAWIASADLCSGSCTVLIKKTGSTELDFTYQYLAHHLLHRSQLRVQGPALRGLDRSVQYYLINDISFQRLQQSMRACLRSRDPLKNFMFDNVEVLLKPLCVLIKMMVGFTYFSEDCTLRGLNNTLDRLRHVVKALLYSAQFLID